MRTPAANGNVCGLFYAPTTRLFDLSPRLVASSNTSGGDQPRRPLFACATVQGENNDTFTSVVVVVNVGIFCSE